MKVIIAAALAAATTLGFVAAASGADLLIDAPAVSATESTDWSGAYVGASLGLGQGVVTWDYAFPILQSEDDLDGWVGGLQAGYNLQAGSLVFGVEGNIDWTGLATAGAPDTLPRDIDWMGSLRARVGFAADSLLFYGTAGAVVAETTGSTFLDDAVAKRHSGWSATAYR